MQKNLYVFYTRSAHIKLVVFLKLNLDETQAKSVHINSNRLFIYLALRHSHMNKFNRDIVKEITKRVENDSVIALGNGQGILDIAENLGPIADRIKGVVTSSITMEKKVKAVGLSILDPNEANAINIYIDSAVEVSKDFVINKKKDLKFTRAKIMAYQAIEFICIVEKSNYLNSFDNTSVLLEILPYTRSLVMKKLKSLNAHANWHKDIITENGNFILEAIGLDLREPWEIEDALDLIPGVVASSIFASVIPDFLILADKSTAQCINMDDVLSFATVH